MMSMKQRAWAVVAAAFMAWVLLPGVTKAAPREWTWMGGSNTIRQAGVYGTKGVPDAANVPGARQDSISWTDGDGNLWLFGGTEYDGTTTQGNLNDLWRYDLAANEWTWMSGSNTRNQVGVYGTKGVPDPANVPGVRCGSISWIDGDDNLWLFGGYGYDSTTTRGRLNDLWRYESATNQWTWMSGSNTRNQVGVYGTIGVPADTNVPGGRWKSISWVDSTGNLWLLGGSGYGSTTTINYLNDLWRYDPATNQWTWVSGANTNQQVGVYGTKGVPAAANVPGARGYSISWVDGDDNLWLFGGIACANTTAAGKVNDLWRYDPATNQWTWMSGANTNQQVGVYGTKGVPAAANVPGAREDSISWVDSDGNFWLFGGVGYGSSTNIGLLNDLWRYDPAANQWTWMSGTNTLDQAGVYGIKGVPAAANVPSAREDSISWIDGDGNLWLFGGTKYDQTTAYAYLNDLWRYELQGCITDSDCDDGAFCNGAEMCVEGVCGMGDSPCRATDTCDELNDQCIPECASDAGCDDGLYCNGAETCIDGVCGMGDSPCRATDTCDELNDQCIPECASDAACDDGFYCNGAEICVDGACVAGGSPCQVGELCDGTNDRCVECLSDSDCDDGVFCNGAETCLDGLCDAGSSPCSGGLLCNELFDRCALTCLDNGDCPNGEICDVKIGSCVSCVSDTDCDGDLEVCFNGSCYQTGVSTCAQNADCIAGDWCQEEVCRPMNCTDDFKCGEGWACYGPECRPVGAQCATEWECAPGYECIDWMCEKIPDDPPAIGDGPFVAAGWWPLLSASSESPTYFNQNRSVLWTFSDDFAACSEDCTHSAEYQVLGGDTWAPITVSSDAANGYAWVDLPIESLHNATTYEFRFAVTDCASQTTQSGTYYFRVATSDAPPAITGGPWLAAGSWPVLPTAALKAFTLNQAYNVLWTFSDDYASCTGLCTHRARFRKVGDTAWTSIPVSTDPAGDWYAYTTLPAGSLENGTYQFRVDVRDCAGQLIYSKGHYFKVEVIN